MHEYIKIKINIYIHANRFYLQSIYFYFLAVEWRTKHFGSVRFSCCIFFIFIYYYFPFLLPCPHL